MGMVAQVSVALVSQAEGEELCDAGRKSSEGGQGFFHDSIQISWLKKSRNSCFFTGTIWGFFNGTKIMDLFLRSSHVSQLSAPQRLAPNPSVLLPTARAVAAFHCSVSGNDEARAVGCH